MRNNLRIYDGDVIKVKKSLNPKINQLNRAIKSNLNPKEIRITVSGRVNYPGKKFINKSSSLNDAILTAGGTKVLKGKIVFIRFNNDGTIERRKSSTQKIKKGSYENPILQNNDLIFVSNNAFNITSEVINEISSPLEDYFLHMDFIRLLLTKNKNGKEFLFTN